MGISRVILAAVFAVAGIASPAAAASPSEASVRMLDCSPWQPSRGGAVTFEARMSAFTGVQRMALRIRLLEKTGDGEFRRVSAPGLDKWLSSRGAGAFVHEQRIQGLRQGAVYRAVVHFRWYDARDDRIASTRRRSTACRQVGSLPNLKVVSIDSRRGTVEETAVYRVKVANRGGSEARRVGVLLRVDGEVLDEVEVIDVLQPGSTRTVKFSGPVCRERLTVVVDPKDLITESRERDNTRAPACL